MKHGEIRESFRGFIPFKYCPGFVLKACYLTWEFNLINFQAELMQHVSKETFHASSVTVKALNGQPNLLSKKKNLLIS